MDIVYQHRLVFCHHGDDMVHAEVAEDAGFNLDFLRVGLPFDFVAGLKLGAGHHVRGLEHPHSALVEIGVYHQRTGGLAV